MWSSIDRKFVPAPRWTYDEQIAFPFPLPKSARNVLACRRAVDGSSTASANRPAAVAVATTRPAALLAHAGRRRRRSASSPVEANRFADQSRRLHQRALPRPQTAKLSDVYNEPRAGPLESIAPKTGSTVHVARHGQVR